MYKKYDEMIESLMEAAKEQVAKGVFCPEVDGDGLGKVVDMIKDLEDAKKNCYEACYYHTVVKGMQEYESDGWHDGEYQDLMGYNRHRNAKGQYSTASGRTGGKMGFHPDYADYRTMEPRVYEDPQIYHALKRMMGYSDNQNRGNQSRPVDNRNGNFKNMGYDDGFMPEFDHDRLYDEYQMAMRNYTQSRSISDKTMADNRAEEFVVNGLMNFREIYKEADPVLRKKLKENFSGFMEEME